MSELLQLRPYQDRMRQHLLDNPFCALWADMGAGKSATTLSAVLELLDRLDVSRVLVVATKRVAKNTWPKEIKRWSAFEHLSCRVIEAPDLQLKRVEREVTCKGKKVTLKRMEAQAEVKALVGAATVTTIHRDLLQYLVVRLGPKHWPWEMVVIDESSGFREPDSKRFKAVKVLRKHGCVQRIVELSGTPSPKSLLNLWAQLYLLDEGARLGKTLTAYRERFFVPDKKGRDGQVFSWTPKPGAAEEIHALVSDICVSLLPEDVVDLPKRSFHDIEVELPAPARAAYDQMERTQLVRVAGENVVALTRANLVGKLLQIAGGIAFDDGGTPHLLHTAKLDALEELAESLDGRPLLVAYWFNPDRDRLLKRFPQARVLDDDPGTEDAWNRGDIPMLLIHPMSGAHGLNLQFNNGYGVWFGPIYDLELYLQLNKRLHRPGRGEPVLIYHLLAQNTIEAAVLASLDEKNRGQDNLLKAVRLRLDEMKGEANA